MSKPIDLTLFSTSAETARFRLERFEVYNWGAFHQTVCSLPLQGENALLTGANGAGKTTLVDALITLLTPNPERFYNQSAGFEDRKRMRRTEDYVLGVYGRSAAGKERLRGLQSSEGTYSVLLGVFSNKDYNQVFTLAHLYWFKNDEVQKRYYITPIALTIADHFQFSGDIRDFNTRMTKNFQARAYDSFPEYAHDFIPKIGMRVPGRSNSNAGRTKPLSLLAKTAGIKVLGNLDGFIRGHMLDETNIETHFDKLKKEYADIADTQQSLDKATRQEQMLMPLMTQHSAWLIGSDEQHRLELAQRAVIPWFARQHVELLEAKIEAQTKQLATLDNELTTCGAELEKLRQEDKDIDFLIRQNEAGQRLDQLQRERATAEKKREEQHKVAARYAALAAPLGLVTEPDAAIFFAQKEQLDSTAKTLQEEKKRQNVFRDELVGQHKEIFQNAATLQIELESLRQRQNNLPSELINLRTRLCRAESIDESELPFVGELVQVKVRERTDWQPALEKLLTPFSMHIPVSVRRLSSVVQWVRDNDLGTLLRFTEADDRSGESLSNDLSPDIAANKLEVQPQSQFAPWLRDELNRRYPHRCTADTAEYKRAQQALTPEGLYKSGKQHPKDDRKHRRTQFVLGWDNHDTIRRLEHDLSKADNTLSALAQRIKSVETKVEAIDRQLADLARLHEFTSFDTINFRETEQHITELIAQIEELKRSSEQLKSLQTRQQQIQKALKGAENKRDNTLQQQTKIKGELDRYNVQRQTKQTDSAALDESDPAWHVLQAYATELGELGLLNIENAQKYLYQKLTTELNQLKDLHGKREQELLLLMTKFKQPPKEILDAFPAWANDTYNLSDPAIEYIGQYTALLERIQSDQLPELRERNQARAGSDIGNAIQVFQQQLDEQLIDHQENISNINRSLRTLPYANDTYLQIVAEPNTRKGRIGEFYHLLHNWDYDRATFRLVSSSEQQEILRETVQRIGQLIQRLDKDRDWRQEVTDVRNWLTFKTQQVYRHDDTPKPGTLLNSTGALSGGEQAKLTYTVLAAALTYQFNISTDSRNAHSFRFILVDEAFSKLDPENSTYLLDLLSNLHFQMLLITPNTNTKMSEGRMTHLIFVKKEDEMPPRSAAFVYSVKTLLEAQQQQKAG